METFSSVRLHAALYKIDTSMSIKKKKKKKVDHIIQSNADLRQVTVTLSRYEIFFKVIQDKNLLRDLLFRDIYSLYKYCTETPRSESEKKFSK